ncbi:hypothetical protein B4113_2586 [Geobacillus sp. B4113_201601]|nr:hypothetical protein B4113_2586 [Geobacillus sp. B4113_201601]
MFYHPEQRAMVKRLPSLVLLAKNIGKMKESVRCFDLVKVRKGR